MIAWKAACAILVASQLIDRVGAFRQLTTMKAVAPGLTTRKSVVKNAFQAAVIAAGLAPTRSARAATLDLDGLRAYAEQAMVAGEFGLAEDALTQLLERGNPRDVVALSDRGNCKSAVGRFQEAVQDFEAALAINPNVPDVLIGRESRWSSYATSKGQSGTTTRPTKSFAAAPGRTTPRASQIVPTRLQGLAATMKQEMACGRR